MTFYLDEGSDYDDNNNNRNTDTREHGIWGLVGTGLLNYDWILGWREVALFF